jgi:hypothetical protein
MQKALRVCLSTATVLGEMSRIRVAKAARKLAGQGGSTVEQLQALTEDVLATGLVDRESLRTLLRFEKDRVLGLVGLATADEVEVLNSRVRELEAELHGKSTRPETSVPGDSPAPPGTPAASASRGVAAKKTVAKKAAKTVRPGKVTPPGKVAPGTGGKSSGVAKSAAVKAAPSGVNVRKSVTKAGSPRDLSPRPTASAKTASGSERGA